MMEAGRIETLDPSIDARGFRGALGNFVTGVTIVTTRNENGPVGIVANSFSSVSLEPPLVLWSPAKSSKRFSDFAEAQHFVVNILSAEQRDLCAAVARSKTAIGEFPTAEGLHGMPLIGGALATFECDLHAVHDAGDHAIILGRVTRCGYGVGEPMVFHGGKYGRFKEA